MSDQLPPAQPQGPSWRIDSWFPDLDESLRRNLKIYHDELQKFNRTVNLVSAKTLPFADVIHFADSILASHLIAKDLGSKKLIWDLGGGNGFPGLVFGLMFPSIQVRITDIDQKKIEFVKHIASICHMKNIDAVVMSLDKLEANSIETCMNRSTASISKLILATRKCVKAGGTFYHLKAENWSAEVGEIPTQLCSVWSPALVGEYKLPIGSIKFAVVKTQKIG